MYGSHFALATVFPHYESHTAVRSTLRSTFTRNHNQRHLKSICISPRSPNRQSQSAIERLSTLTRVSRYGPRDCMPWRTALRVATHFKPNSISRLDLKAFGLFSCRRPRARVDFPTTCRCWSSKFETSATSVAIEVRRIGILEPRVPGAAETR